MEYRVKLTAQFLEEFDEMIYYISSQLKNIDASNRLREKVTNKILLLENSPRMCTGIEKMVYIAHAYYGGRNYLDGGLL